jgi:hypothetical protein
MWITGIDRSYSPSDLGERAKRWNGKAFNALDVRCLSMECQRQIASQPGLYGKTRKDMESTTSKRNVIVLAENLV